MPARAQSRCFATAILGSNAYHRSRIGAKLLRAGPESHREPGEVSCAQRGGFGDMRAARRARPACRPGTASAGRSPPRRRPPAAPRGRWVSLCTASARRPPGTRCFRGGAGDVPRLGLAAQADQQAPRMRVPMGRAQAYKCRDEAQRRRCRERSPPALPPRQDCRIRRRLSRSHCTTAPPMKTLPSSAYSSFCRLLASVVIRRASNA